jgi:hypothetical protein
VAHLDIGQSIRARPCPGRSIKGPVLDVPTTIANWLLYTPREIKFLRTSGNLDQGVMPGAFVDEPFMQLAQFRDENGSPEIVELDRTSNGSGKLGQAAKRGRELLSPASVPIGAYEPYYNPSGSLAEGNAEERTKSAQAQVGEPFFEKGGDRKDFASVVGGLAGRLQESGILPLKIQLPKAGSVYRFSRLMTTGEALTLRATYAHVRMPWLPMVLAGLVLLPVGGLTFVKFHGI